ncbi:cation:proton antiporter domain-containing protein [Roseivirga pacifica]
MNAYNIIIALSCVIIFSHIFNFISKRTNVPSVILLIILGVGINFGLQLYGFKIDSYVMGTLEVLGIVGLIMIVLEAAIDLELTKEKWPIIWKSFLMALISLVGCAFIISLIINQFYREDPVISLLYAVPLSIVSSAIVIPSVGNLVNKKKEFMIYESTFSDILGIMFFYFVVENVDTTNANAVIYSVIGNIVITIIVSIALGYGLILMFQRLKGDVKLFMLIAVLVLMYAIGKQLHLSSLVIILIFGLILNNNQLFFVGKMKEWIDQSTINGILKDLHLVTRETAFVVRTFFFVVFGSTIDLQALLNLQVLGISLGIVAVFFAVRFILLKIFYTKEDSILPEFFITPRGLITILLFFSIPAEIQSDLFQPDIILIVIVVTSIMMTIGLVKFGDDKEAKKEVEPAIAAEGDSEISYFLQREGDDEDGSEEEEDHGPSILDELAEHEDSERKKAESGLGTSDEHEDEPEEEDSGEQEGDEPKKD